MPFAEKVPLPCLKINKYLFNKNIVYILENNCPLNILTINYILCVKTNSNLQTNTNYRELPTHFALLIEFVVQVKKLKLII